MQFLDNSKHLFKVWLSQSRISIIREMEFRGNFFIGIVRQVLWLGSFLFLIEIIFQNTSTLAGWKQYEVMIVLALSRIIEGLMGTIFLDNIIGVSEKVQKGTFDYILTKPLPTQFAAFFNRVSLDNVGNLLAGVGMLMYIFINYPIGDWSNFLIAIILAALGITIYYSLLVIVASLVFYIERLESLWSFNMLFSEPLTVPFDIFPRAPRIALTYLLPIAFTVFVPAQALTNRLHPWQIPVAFALAIMFLLLANIAWSTGMRRYTSASS